MVERREEEAFRRLHRPDALRAPSFDTLLEIDRVANEMIVSGAHVATKWYVRLIGKITAIFGGSQGDVEKNCVRVFAERNGFESTTKKLAIEPLKTQVRTGLARGDPAFVIKRVDEESTMFIKGFDASMASRPGAIQRSIVAVGSSFFFDIVQPALVAPLRAALEPSPRRWASKSSLGNSPG
jgi:hypothetical protein